MKNSIKNIISVAIILLILLPVGAIAEMRDFIKEYKYQASERDSKVSSRDFALGQVKRLLLEEIGSYLESRTEIKNFEMSKDQIVALTAGIVQIKILDEKWNGNDYWVKAEIKADPEEVSKAIERKRKENAAIERKETQQPVQAIRKATPAITKLYGSKNAKKYHLSSCEWAKKINKRNLIVFKSESDAIKKGYSPCTICNPDKSGI